MNEETLIVSIVLPIPPSALYHAYIDSQAHTAFTGSPAVIENRVGGKMTAWDGYISGRIIALEPDRKIVQTWRTADFQAEDEDSMLQLEFTPEGGQTKLTLTHSNLPSGTADGYKQGWIDYYFEPMQAYFSEGNHG